MNRDTHTARRFIARDVVLCLRDIGQCTKKRQFVCCIFLVAVEDTFDLIKRPFGIFPKPFKQKSRPGIIGSLEGVIRHPFPKQPEAHPFQQQLQFRGRQIGKVASVTVTVGYRVDVRPVCGDGQQQASAGTQNAPHAVNAVEQSFLRQVHQHGRTKHAVKTAIIKRCQVRQAIMDQPSVRIDSLPTAGFGCCHQHCAACIRPANVMTFQKQAAEIETGPTTDIENSRESRECVLEPQRNTKRIT